MLGLRDRRFGPSSPHPDYGCGYSGNDAIARNGPCYHRSRRNDTAGPDRYAREDDRAGSNPDIILDHYSTPVCPLLDDRNGEVVEIVTPGDDLHARRQQAVISDFETAETGEITTEIEMAVVPDADAALLVVVLRDQLAEIVKSAAAAYCDAPATAGLSAENHDTAAKPGLRTDPLTLGLADRRAVTVAKLPEPIEDINALHERSLSRRTKDR